MKMRIRAIIWFIVLNCCANNVFTEPIENWWLLEIIFIIISLIMVVDK